MTEQIDTGDLFDGVKRFHCVSARSRALATIPHSVREAVNL
jgi:hypothetical protein